MFVVILLKVSNSNKSEIEISFVRNWIAKNIKFNENASVRRDKLKTVRETFRKNSGLGWY